MALRIISLVFLLLAADCQGLDSDLESEECELTTGRALSVIKSVRFPEAYGPNVDCRYVVRRRSDSMCSVTFLFNVLDVEYSPGCSGDYLLFEDTGERLCGAKPVGFSRTLSFKKDEVSKSDSKAEVVMNFHSANGTRGGLGYMVTVVQQECPRPSCDVVHEEADFRLATPNYPLPYDNGATCVYTVHRSSPTVCRLALTVRHFELEEDEHCDSDYLKLSDGRRLCGTLKEGQIVEVDFTNDTMVMEFQSDHFTTRNGFELEVHQVDVMDPAQDHKPNLQLPMYITTPISSPTVQTTPTNETTSTTFKSANDTTTLLPSSNSSVV